MQNKKFVICIVQVVIVIVVLYCSFTWIQHREFTKKDEYWTIAAVQTYDISKNQLIVQVKNLSGSLDGEPKAEMTAAVGDEFLIHLNKAAKKSVTTYGEGGLVGQESLKAGQLLRI